MSEGRQQGTAGDGRTPIRRLGSKGLSDSVSVPAEGKGLGGERPSGDGLPPAPPPSRPARPSREEMQRASRDVDLVRPPYDERPRRRGGRA
ncbi:hypothetical protein [Agrobacterium vitis]|uniref:hypothetical protein n=1 Tax=Agrobacterium vitis TaxID=373 RepID=UPI0015724A8D|nr:hypothetical protein [Agrobacterium vitis]NSZ19495.1 hypothetical protein [Agrobacterium vitis]QZO06809.1 hypothetical protein K4831_22030 [Agrobacterium vitis]UJL91541.1 hypothetical protein AVF2S5_26550 [Agrobacterium vitis]BCH62596.1 hypothetical protein RvVAR0630_pl07380 [Agrobacterium vitis]